MAGEYIIDLTRNGSPALTTVYPLEIDGSVSTPRLIRSIDPGSPSNYFTLNGNLAYRFVAGFTFTVSDSAGANGNYTVDVGGSTYTPGGSPDLGGYTTIPVTTNIPSAALPYGQIQYNVPASTSLELPGRGTINYGETLLEDLVHLLENFANSTAPNDPLLGQLWYDTDYSPDPTILVYSGASPEWEALLTEPIADTLFLRLDATNDPITGNLRINANVGINTDPDSNAYTLEVVSTGSPERAALFAGDVRVNANVGINTDPNANTHALEVVAFGSPQLAAQFTGDIQVNSQVIGSDQSAASPTYSFIAEPNTGIFRPGAGQISVATAGSERLNIDATSADFTPVVHVPDGSNTAPAVSFTNETSTGWYRPDNSSISLAIAGEESIQIVKPTVGSPNPVPGSPESFDPTAAVELRVKSTTDANSKITVQTQATNFDAILDLITSRTNWSIRNNALEGSPLAEQDALVFSTDGVSAMALHTNGDLRLAGRLLGGTLIDEFTASAGSPGGSPLQTVLDTVNVPTVSKSAGRAYIQVFVNGILQREATASPANGDYTVTGPKQITFVQPLPANAYVIVYAL